MYAVVTLRWPKPSSAGAAGDQSDAGVAEHSESVRDGAGLDFSDAPCSEVVDQDGRSAARLWRHLSRRACVQRDHWCSRVFWGMIDVDPAKLVWTTRHRGVGSTARPSESWAELDAVAASLSAHYRRW